MHRPQKLVPLGIMLVLGLAGCKHPSPPHPPQPALNVAVVHPEVSMAESRYEAYGGVFAWQEASASVATGGLRLLALHAEVGDRVKKGQLLAELDAAPVNADLAVQEASLAEAESALDIAQRNAARAAKLAPTVAISDQDYRQALAQAQTAVARRDAAKAQVAAQRLRLQFTRIVAPDDGQVLARSGTVGQVAPAGTELFRIIRQDRVEWRGEVPADQLALLRAGGKVEFRRAAKSFTGVIRKVSPAVEPGTRTGLVYVDLPAAAGQVPGQYLQGTFLGAAHKVLALPSSAVITRSGRQMVLEVGAGDRVAAKPVETGPSLAGDRVAVLSGVTEQARVVESGGAFLSDGDLVAVTGGRK